MPGFTRCHCLVTGVVFVKNKTMRLSIAILTLLLSAMIGEAAPTERFAIRGRDAEVTIRERLLEFTPVGSKIVDVSLFLNQRLLHKGGSVPSRGNSLLRQLVATGKKKQGDFQFEIIPIAHDIYALKMKDFCSRCLHGKKLSPTRPRAGRTNRTSVASLPG
jgi:hypothetical protein